METAQDFIKRKKQQFQDDQDKLIGMKDIGRNGRFYFIKEAITLMIQSNLDQKVFVIERLKREKSKGIITYKSLNKIGNIEHRIGYYIVGKIGRAKNKWIWGQFCPLIPKKDFDKLILKAKKDRTIL